jgi:ribonuclease PH
MAYLPGERPLLNPWNDLSQPFSSDESEDSRVVNISSGVAGVGTAYIEAGSGNSLTKMIVSVRGPRQQPTSRSVFEVETAYTAFATPEDSRFDLSKDISAFLKEAIEGAIRLDLYPQSAVTLHVKILQGGLCIHSTLPAAIIASSVALENAGLELRDRVLGVALEINDSGDLRLNPGVTSKRTCATIALWEKSRALSLIHITGGSISGGVDTIDPLIDAADMAIGELSLSLASRFNI